MDGILLQPPGEEATDVSDVFDSSLPLTPSRRGPRRDKLKRQQELENFMEAHNVQSRNI